MVNVRQVKLLPVVDEAPEVRELLEEHTRSNPLNETSLLARNTVGEMPAFYARISFASSLRKGTMCSTISSPASSCK